MKRFYDWTQKINSDELSNVISTLKNGGIVVFPTETVYGIAGNAFSKKAIDRIYEAKKRPKEKAMNIMISDKEEITKYAYIKSNKEQEIIDSYMPGPITIILEKKEGIGEGFTLENNTIGVRIPDNEIALSILRKLDFPIIAPSANISGKDSGVDAREISKELGDFVDIIIDGGILKNAEASTIVKVENDKVIVLRQGRIKF